jgi:hypothetical protein
VCIFSFAVSVLSSGNNGTPKKAIEDVRPVVVPFGYQFLAGAVAGVVETGVMYPLDGIM